MKEKFPLLLLVSVSCSHKTAELPKSGYELPNIILLMADDLGDGRPGVLRQ